MQSGAKELLTAAAPLLIADLLRRFGQARVRVGGVSMLPAIRPRDVLIVGSCTIEHVNPAEVVLFTIGNRLFAHRVVRLGSNPSGLLFVVTKGDTHRHDDLPIGSSQLLGRVLAVSRNGRLQAAPFPYSRVASTVWMRASRCAQLATRITPLLLRDDDTNESSVTAA